MIFDFATRYFKYYNHIDHMTDMIDYFSNSFYKANPNIVEDDHNYFLITANGKTFGIIKNIDTDLVETLHTLIRTISTPLNEIEYKPGVIDVIDTQRDNIIKYDKILYSIKFEPVIKLN